jgi:hypothetical protein
MSDTAQLEALLGEVLAELRALRTAFAHAVAAIDRTNSIALTSKDRKALAVLLPEIARTVGSGVVFSVHDLLTQCALDRALHATLHNVLRTEALDGTASRRLGMMLTRSCGSVNCGMMLERVGKTRDGTLWQVVTVILECHRASPASPRS